ncbi:NAD-dependent epimerase/dehydratase family protein [Dyadobacter crusticola]|uniref:NAD-dependent epimerase/dehydratase family protein n=1 Tax=Dyadobacter crusticola TaxID=292407 RepID=UPI00068A7660|nr:NAD(P)-dependent oxidoreductase [Dyadobacter crusticola]
MRTEVAVIGSDSFLSIDLVKTLSAKYQITGFSRNNSQKLAEHVVFDYPKTKIDFDALLRFDHIIYCAGSGIQAGKGEDFVYELNTYLPLEIALFLNKHSFEGKYITFGSYAEIGNNTVDRAYTEDDLLMSRLPVPNNYCVSKRLLSRFFDSANFSTRFFHLILPTIYGKGENSMRLVPYLVSSLTNKQKPKLTGGHQKRQYIHSKDVASLLDALLQSDDVPAGIYNVPSYETQFVKDIIVSIYAALGADESLSPDSLQRYDETMKYLELDFTKMKNQFPWWKPTISILDSIEEYLN